MSTLPPDTQPEEPDTDPLETGEWIEALDALIASEGKERATFLLRRLLQHARMRRVPLPQVLATPYVNTIGLDEQPPYQGNLEIESRLSAWVADPVIRAVGRLVPAGSWQELLIGDFGLLTLGIFNALVTVLPILSAFFLMLGLLEDIGYLPNLVVRKTGTSFGLL